MSMVEKIVVSEEAERVQALFDTGAITEEEYQRSISDLAYMITGME